MPKNQAKNELQKAYDEFIIKVEQAKKDYNQKIDGILKKIDELKISKVKRKLNI
ncbi:MAG: hypothetical protein Q7K65_03800 [Candidatus Buchananbacteria bacterium]|nr:hypothetical protein [Candidatus Buchananbacteria bacterium]